MNVLITGAGGFLGYHLVNFISQKIKKVNLFTLGRKKVPKCKHFFLDDLNNVNKINSAISSIKPDYVFHLAGTSNNSLDLDIIESVNTTYSNNILDSLEINDLHNHTKIMIVGSSAEYGTINYKDLPISENQKPKPKTVYGKTKYSQTIKALLWQQNSRKLVVVRPFNIIGEKISKNLAVGNFFFQICSIARKGILKTGNINVERDFVDVFDVINIMWKLINNDKAYGEVVNICSGKSSPLIDLVNLMIKLSNKEIEHVIDHDRIRKDDIPVHFGDKNKLLSIIGDYKFIPWTESITKIMRA